MAWDQSALLEVLEALEAADGDDRIRSATAKICQALIEATICPALIEAEPTGVSVPPRMSAPRPGPERNGSRPRTLSTTAGRSGAADLQAVRRLDAPDEVS